nr:MAG TPA: hypothetical protein [Caudoviricetes sp.]
MSAAYAVPPDTGAKAHAVSVRANRISAIAGTQNFFMLIYYNNYSRK